ncbi:hypothetical protein CERZMDRAFT_116426 [Cercospora zeae-maydis SCOH1-5]|uniref:Major facilitator superfamily (MFS) profile domain-containing protein n=1 Tax=Cercospora zeae-maydis SCOH1-5 TaxID=717836 RepID=A0A6A6FT36_9PEZI|nr:hypothetical protein CERZMDRAFT_116426 [Cercospora zeae-maydis SCOH1-5]
MNLFHSGGLLGQLLRSQKAYLDAIGIPLSLSALLWIAGPLCGMLVQPMLSAMSDSYMPKPGGNKRKPFIVAGAGATVFCMLGLAWIPDIIKFFARIFGYDENGIILVANAFIWIYGLNIAVQPLQGGVRTLLHEQCSEEAQSYVAAWQGVIVASGVICGYFLASLSFGQTGPGAMAAVSRFQSLTLVVCAAVLVCAGVTVMYPYDNAGHENSCAATSRGGRIFSLSDACRRNWECLQTMSKTTRITLQVQFFSWMGWFPALYYQTAYLSSVLKNVISHDIQSNSEAPNEAEHAARAALPSAVIMLATAVCLPAFARSLTKLDSDASLSRLLDLWLLGHILFALMMGFTTLVNNEMQAILIFALVGIPRSLTAWVPFTLVGREMTRSRNAGTLNSLHNAAISAPQIVAAALCAILFVIARNFGVENETVSAMLLSSLASLLAAWKTTELRAAFLD